jgi:hypothetical protein
MLAEACVMKVRKDGWLGAGAQEAGLADRRHHSCMVGGIDFT